METQAAAQKPQLVVTAINLLWASLAVGLVKILMDFSNLSGVAPAEFTNFILIVTFAVIAFLIFKISAGRNWARITLLVMFISGLLPTLSIVQGEFSRSAAVGALSVAQIGLQVYALFLLFTQPCSSWFHKLLHAPLQTVKNIEVGASSISSPATSPLFASAQVLADLNNHSQTRSKIADPPPLGIITPDGIGPEIGVDEEAIYTAIADEIENGKVLKGLWTRLYAECGGDETQTKVLYIKQRAGSLIAAERARLAHSGSITDFASPSSHKETHKVSSSSRLKSWLTSIFFTDPQWNSDPKPKTKTFADPQWNNDSKPKTQDTVAPLPYRNSQDVKHEDGVIEKLSAADAEKLNAYYEKYSDQLKDLGSRFSYTPLHFAAENDLEEFVRLLLKSGAEKNATDRFGLRALDLAKKYRHGNLVKLLSVHPDAATTAKQATSAPEANPSKESAPSSVPAQHNLKNEEPSEAADDSVRESGSGILGLYKAAIGEKNTSYYTKKFEQFDRQGAGFHASFNTPAFFFPSLWALYRKMYGWFFVMIGITSIAFLMTIPFMFIKEMTISSFIYGAPHLLFAIFADSIYQRHVRKDIVAAQLALRHEPELLAYLRVKGGVNGWVRWLGLVPIIGILAAIVVPAYNDSQQRVAGQQSQQPAPGSEKDPLGLYRGASPQNQQPVTGGYGPNDKPVGFGGYGPNDKPVD